MTCSAISNRCYMSDLRSELACMAEAPRGDKVRE
ncbi:hypothetical protein CPT_Mendera_078 [Stenotrophomonas phage Mendera]|uniref:Uncharacterized protein n=1 Tax=Stenotrophomonas phage Mendera TaxID=2650877 RepID=A0A5P8PIS3_9CAUD|nr:hypothetical protein HWC60_gp078 [Stenotrophomonas phage Mendera]QFR56627.1 hypothetical protein CPT_Mendera_078 [Stenotrophomonas phage Mendera]